MLTPLKSKVLGQPFGESKKSSLIWTPEVEKGSKQLMLVTAIGDDVKDVKPGDVVILPDNWGGATLTVLDTDTNTREQHFVIDEKDLLAKIEDYDAGI